MAAAIKVENLSKIYRLGEIGTGTISRDVERWVRMNVLRQDDPFLRIGETNERGTKGGSDVVYSLRDINFEIEQGDAIGIIGRNGAGKSTLLKILSRVTAPTTGRIIIDGRVASLLEVGTGFHPELTGRENVYLNGAIQGMRKKEINRKLDEIIDFSGVERYIDTPVKRYSSGMYVRLAFAVAAHLESEILIVDEVLAVGDAEFQRKCLGKMGDVSKGEGRTVLFVSHNMNSIVNLCSQSLLLNSGKIEYAGESSDVVLRYANAVIVGKCKVVNGYKLANDLILEEFCINSNTIISLQELEFSILIKSKTKNNYSSIAIFIYDCYDQKIAFIDLRDSDLHDANITNPVLFIRGKVKAIPFVPGIYNIGLHVQSSICYKDYFNLLSFEVQEREMDILPYEVSVRGRVELETSFNIEKIRNEINV